MRIARPPLSAGIAAAILGVAAATGLLFGLRQLAPVVSLGVVYVLVVLVVSTYWGLVMGIATALLSALAFNFFHIPPTGRFAVASGENWVGLLTFLAVAAAASAVADLARARALEAQERRQEADLAAGAARTLLGGTSLESGLAQTAHGIAEALALPSAQLVLGDASAPPASDDRRTAFPLQRDGATLATLVLPAVLPPAVEARLRERIVPALEAVLAAAIEREALLSEVVETVALRRSDDLKTAILRSVSHDLRSPLTAMISSGEALGSRGLDEEERAALSRAVVEEGARLERLIGKLLDLSRLEAGEALPRLEAIDLGEVLTAAREDLVDPGRVRLQLDRDLPLLRADAVQLERAFANLMENAVAHGDGELVSVRARAVGSRLVVRVVDRGLGIPVAEQERIFTPFYRGEGAGATAAGSGLGLAIVRGFVQANGGTVRVESLPGQGASFVVEFPLAA
ncbi:MAG: two-component system, OmpR family, sensor histidine kinase KdpD [Baekduia sp.]|jgi:two-component system sensor histidine kinase KdpD|nr:two-component system, OmpR family, sensor histidine kinase KdpD [Baekduia sp.]